MSSSSGTSIRTQTRAVVRSLLAQTAMGLFADRGFDETTVDDVAAAAGVSRRTLFNYFASKEDLALSGLAEQGDKIAARLAERPVDESPWVSLRHAFSVLEEIEASLEHRLQLITMIFSHDSLRAGHADKQSRWTDLLAPVIETRLPPSPSRAFEARAIVASAITSLGVANAEWVRQSGETSMLDLYDIAVTAVRTAR